MCLCDNKFFKVVNVKTEKFKLYKRAASIAKRFNTCKDDIFFAHEKSLRIKGPDGDVYAIKTNKHLDCVILRNKIIKHFNHRPSYLTKQRMQAYQERSLPSKTLKRLNKRCQ